MANARGLPEGIPTAPSASVDHGAAPERAAEGYLSAPANLSRTRPHVRAQEFEIRRRHAFVAPLERAAEVPASLPSVFLRALASRGPWGLRAEPRLEGWRGRSLTLPSPKAVARAVWCMRPP